MPLIMKTKRILFIAGISSLLLLTDTLNAQVGTGDVSVRNSREVEEQNAQRVFSLETQLKQADSELKEIRKMEKEAKSAVREAKAALRAEKKAQKSRKQANAQARKAEKMMN